MKRLLILTTVRSENKESLTSYLKGKLGAKFEVTLELFSDLVFEIESGKVTVTIAGRDIRDFDLVYIRRAESFSEVAKTLATSLDFLNIKYFDSAWSKGGFLGNKLVAITKLAMEGLPVAPTFYCKLEKAGKNIDCFIKKVGFPIIAKELNSQRLEGVYLLKNKKEISKLPVAKKNGNKAQYLFQKFIIFEKEYRLLVLRNEVKIVHTKIKRDYKKIQVGYDDPDAKIIFLNPKEISWEMRKIAVKSAKILGLEIAGVDVCIDQKTGQVFLIEVNRGPGIEYDTAISPELPALADFFKKELSSSK